jgi:uncharacterized protein (TIGR02246 family)
VSVVDDVLTAKVAGLRAHDADAVVAAFEPDALLFGSGGGESARGHDGIRALVQGLFDQGYTLGWTWEHLHEAGEGDVVWFVGPAVLRIENDGAVEERPYRLSGVLRRLDGTWRIAMFNGSEPAED